MLEKAHHQHPVVAAQDVFGAVAVVHVKVHHRHAFEAMALQRVFRRNGDVVENAKPHGLVAFSVVAGRAHPAKSVFHFTGDHAVGRRQHGARSAQCRAVAVHIQRGVRIDGSIGGAARLDIVSKLIAQPSNGSDHHAAVGQLNVGQGRDRCFTLRQCIGHTRGQQPVFNGVKALRAFGMARAHFVLFALLVGEISSRVHSGEVFS